VPWTHRVTLLSWRSTLPSLAPTPCHRPRALYITNFVPPPYSRNIRRESVAKPPNYTVLSVTVYRICHSEIRLYPRKTTCFLVTVSNMPEFAKWVAFSCGRSYAERCPSRSLRRPGWDDPRSARHCNLLPCPSQMSIQTLLSRLGRVGASSASRLGTCVIVSPFAGCDPTLAEREPL